MVLARAKKLSSKAPLGATLIVFSSIFFASYGIWTKLIGPSLGGYTASAIRSVLTLAVVVPIAWALHKFEPLALKQNRGAYVGLALSSMFNWGPLYFAVIHAGVGVALTINYAAIVIGMFLWGGLFAGERFTTDKFISTIISFAGLGLIFAPNLAGIGWLALLAAVVAGLSGSANGVSAKLLKYNATQSTVAVWVVSVVVNVNMALIFEHLSHELGAPLPWLPLVAFALASVAASWSFVGGMKLIDAGAAGILGLLEIVFGVLFGVVFFAEHIGPIVALGIGLIIVAAAIPYVKEYRSRQIADG